MDHALSVLTLRRSGDTHQGRHALADDPFVRQDS
jgi:hypothetical protein